MLNDLAFYYYYCDILVKVLNLIFLTNIGIAVVVFSNNHILKIIYNRSWILMYFLFFNFIFLLLFLYKIYLSFHFVDISNYQSTLTKLPFYNYFSDVIVCLSMSVTIISWTYLSERFMYKSHFYILYFYIFVLCTINMVYTSNLATMFVFFEFIFLPSLFFVYQFGYSKKVDKTVSYLLNWTLTGSFVVLFSLVYVYTLAGSLSLYVLPYVSFSVLEKNLLFLLFFLGFGVKIPVWPFYYWLTKVHVEAPAGFSIFLSGFLVKTAFFCLVYFVYLFQTYWLNIIACTILFWGVLDSSIRMWTCLDIKKLIAFATIQEMNLIMLFLFFLNTGDYLILNIFLFVHGLLSALFFFLVDQVQKKYNTRSILSLSGLDLFAPNLSTLIWLALLIFRGFPLFIKFFIEWELLNLLLINFKLFGLFIFLLCSVFGVVGFFKTWLTVIYGQPTNLTNKYDIFKSDAVLGLFLVTFLFFLSFFLIFFKC